MLVSRFRNVLLLCVLFSLFSCVPSQNVKFAEDAANRGDLVAAHDYYMAALREGPTDKNAENALKSIRIKLTDQARSNAAANFQSTGGNSMAALRSSLGILQKAGRFDPDGSLLGNDIRQYMNGISQMEENNKIRAGQARQFMASQNWADAGKKLAEIEQTDPGFKDLPRLKQDYKTGYGSLLEKQILAAYQSGNVKQARAAMQKWTSLGFPQAEHGRLAAVVKKQEITALSKQSEKLIRRHQYYKAFLDLNSSPYKADMTATLEKIKRQGSRFYLDQAEKRRNSGDTGRAYLEAIKGKELNPDLPGLFEMHRDTRDLILEKVQHYIAIPAFDSPRDNPDAGKQFSDALISYLFRILPYGINIVERGKIDILMQEHKREFTEVANILNVDLIITGNVSLLKIDRQDNQRQSTVKAPVGEKLVINPEYELYIQSGSAKNPNVKPPVKMIRVKEFGNFTITKGRGVVKGFADVAIRIFDTSKGRITYAQEFNSTFQEEDEYQDALQLAGIEGDPLMLPTDTEVSEKLRKQTVKQLADIIQKQFEKREKDFLKRARYHMSRREKQKAINELSQGFLYCVKAKVPFKDPDFSEIREKIIELTEIDFM